MAERAATPAIPAPRRRLRRWLRRGLIALGGAVLLFAGFVVWALHCEAVPPPLTGRPAILLARPEVDAQGRVHLGASWFLNHTAERLYPDALIDGKEASVDDAIETAAEYLYQAHMPLVYGLSNVTCEAQREAVSLAEKVGAVIDSHTSL